MPTNQTMKYTPEFSKLQRDPQERLMDEIFKLWPKPQQAKTIDDELYLSSLNLIKADIYISESEFSFVQNVYYELIVCINGLGPLG